MTGTDCGHPDVATLARGGQAVLDLYQMEATTAKI
jgi:hypothetical protein